VFSTSVGTEARFNLLSVGFVYGYKKPPSVTTFNFFDQQRKKVVNFLKVNKVDRALTPTPTPLQIT